MVSRHQEWRGLRRKMKVRMDGNHPCQFWVSSESDGGVEYCVNICENPGGLDEDGDMVFNGTCGLTPILIHGCADFRYRCAPALNKPENMGKVFRCKHLLSAEKYALKVLKPYLKKANPNIPDEEQV